MHLVVFVEELVRSRGAVLNMPSWFNAYTRVCEPHHSTFVSIASCLQGLSLKKQELVSELVAAKHDTEARLRDTKQYMACMSFCWRGFHTRLVASHIRSLGHTACCGSVNGLVVRHGLAQSTECQTSFGWSERRGGGASASVPNSNRNHNRNHSTDATATVTAGCSSRLGHGSTPSIDGGKHPTTMTGLQVESSYMVVGFGYLTLHLIVIRFVLT